MKKDKTGEYISKHYRPFSKERRELRKMWNLESKNVDWVEYLNEAIKNKYNDKN